MSDRDRAKLTADAAERSVIGACLLEPDTVSWLDLEAGHFANPRNKAIWESLQALERDGAAIDLVTLERALTRAGMLDAVGGVAYLGQLVTDTPTAANVEHYAGILREAAITRCVALLGGEVAELIKQGRTGEDLLSEVSARVAACEVGKRNEAVSIGDAVYSEATAIREFFETDQKFAGVPTGMAILDEKIGGIPISVTSILTARPGEGKTATAFNMAINASMAGYPALFLSNEDRRPGLSQRAIAIRTGIDVSHLRSRDLTRDEQAQLGKAVDHYRKRVPLLIEHIHGMPASQIVRRVRATRRRHGTKLVILDYLNLVPPEASEAKFKKHEYIESAIGKLADLAGKDDLALVICTQLKRSAEERTDRPRLSDIKDAGAIEQVGKLILALWPTKLDHEIDCWVLKNHQGPRAKVVLNFARPYCRIW